MSDLPSRARLRRPRATGAAPSHVDLAAVVVSATAEQPQVLVLERRGEDDSLPSGPLASDHRTLEAGLRAWVERQTTLRLGYVEQLYTFGDIGRLDPAAAATGHDLSIAYLALVHEARPAAQLAASWRDWYACFPWEDWRGGRPPIMDRIEARLRHWLARSAKAAREGRMERIELAFGFEAGGWNDERALERYELLYEAGLVAEATRQTAGKVAASHMVGGRPMGLDHRRILATAISRLRGKIKYRPVIFELMPDAFTLLDLQRTVEALSGVTLHKQNFRRLVENEGLVEETGEMSEATGGRPARLVRFRREVLRERPAAGVRLPGTRRTVPR
ncbi:MAG: hypothetical protein HY834_06140 [Devosia nanyangense]|uniref:NrtR DNA-binding winged helix domain-containing protein n=1 Tax=Devosia nanyangense TaxID=1228055 RepID=A0A933L2J7_9HYPH|nr:hypothetical protein [Devosia nanyangense]